MERNNYALIAENPKRAFPAALFPLIKNYIGDLHGKKVLVPSSGDNIAAFGFHLLGARVTSCDLAENQIKNAEIVADNYGWNIEFLCQDSMKLDMINDGEYDLVFTSNGVHVWIDDMQGMYRNFHRVLKRGGYNIFFETHPMSRPFDNTTYDIKIVKLYEDVGPFGDEDPTYGWRTQDFVNAVTSAGFMIREMQEFHSIREDLSDHNYLDLSGNPNDKYNWPGDTFDWKVNPWAALPQCLCLCSQKI
jgi:SAM-dependent methyltransferase